MFRHWQMENNISPVITLKGLRKTGQMYKMDITKNNERLVAKYGGRHSVQVMQDNYNDILESEKIGLAMMMENDFYEDAQPNNKDKQTTPEIMNQFLTELLSNSKLREQVIQMLSIQDSVQS